MLASLLWALPWVLFAAWTAFRPRWPRPLPGVSADAGAHPDRERVPDGEPAGRPLVSVVVPARDEARNIGRCVASLVRQDHPAFEVVVVDDRSTDDTAARAREAASATESPHADLAGPAGPRGRGPSRVVVLEGRELPEGWFGKPWACMQGAVEARGELLLFTDADTDHAPTLLRRAVLGLEEDGAGALTVLGRQETGTFWERIGLPHVLLLIGLRFPDLRDPILPQQWEEAVASGQYVLVRRDAYEAVGGHGAVAGEVVEDIALARALVRAGHPLSVRMAEDGLSTRMYRSLRELVDGFTKNMAAAVRLLGAEWQVPFAVAGGASVLTLLWIAPPVALLLGGAAALLGAAPPAGLLAWAAAATGVGLLFWGAAYLRFGVSPLLAPAYPLGAAVTVWIILRSGIRGRRIEWKGRRYGTG